MERRIGNPIDGGAATSIHFDVYSGGKKSVLLAPKLTYLPMEEGENLASISKGRTVYVFNKSNEIEWLLLSKEEQIPEAGFGPNWFPLKPMDWTILNSGDNEKIGTSSDNVGVYLVHDDTSLK
jgi:hypothetical protein